MTNCPPKLRGDLSKWLCEINTGVYGNVEQPRPIPSSNMSAAGPAVRGGLPSGEENVPAEITALTGTQRCGIAAGNRTTGSAE